MKCWTGTIVGAGPDHKAGKVPGMTCVTLQAGKTFTGDYLEFQALACPVLPTRIVGAFFDTGVPEVDRRAAQLDMTYHKAASALLEQHYHDVVDYSRVNIEYLGS